MPIQRGVEIPVITDAPTPNDVDGLYRLLGSQTVLIPACRGTKQPMRKRWQETTAEETRASDFVRDLEMNNVAVLLGPRSENLIDIDCDDDDFMNDFMRLNSDLCARTLQSKGVRGCHFWFRMKGDYPAKVEVIKSAAGEHVGEFRGGSGNSTIAGTHPSGCEYRILNAVPALEIEFAQIQWPEGYSYPWNLTADEEIACRVGPPFEERKGKATRLNAEFFAEVFMRHTDVIHEETVGMFYIYNEETGLWEQHFDARVAERIRGTCHAWFDDIEPAMAESLRLLLTKRLVDDIVAILRGKVAQSGFFGSCCLRDKRSLLFHCGNGLFRAMPEMGGVPVKFIHQAYDKDYRTRSRFRGDLVKGSACPMYDSLMGTLILPEDIDHVIKILGYLLIDGNPAQHIVSIKGPSNSGKSQIINVLRGLFPDNLWAELRTTQLDGRFEIGSYAGKRILCGPDVKRDFLASEGARRLKALTGGDPLEGEAKNANARLPMHGNMQVIITTNDVLRLAPGEDIGPWRRRLVLIETQDKKPAKIINNFGLKILSEERDAVFSKLIGGAFEALMDLEEYGYLKLPEKFQLGVSGSVEVMGDVAEWVSNSISDGETAIATRDLYSAYTHWCTCRGTVPVSPTVFEKRLAQKMEELGHEASHSIMKDGRQCNGYRGLEVRYAD